MEGDYLELSQFPYNFHQSPYNSYPSPLGNTGFLTLNEKWEDNFKIDFPEFNGNLIAENFVDWLNQVERILEYHEIPNHKRVKLVAIKLKGRASAWCKQFQMQRVRMGKRKIREWPKMKKALEKQFLPFNYMQSLYNNLHNLRQTSSVDDYNEKFYKLLSKLDLQET